MQISDEGYLLFSEKTYFNFCRRKISTEISHLGYIKYVLSDRYKNLFKRDKVLYFKPLKVKVLKSNGVYRRQKMPSVVLVTEAKVFRPKLSYSLVTAKSNYNSRKEFYIQAKINELPVYKIISKRDIEGIKYSNHAMISKHDILLWKKQLNSGLKILKNLKKNEKL